MLDKKDFSKYIWKKVKYSEVSFSEETSE